MNESDNSSIEWFHDIDEMSRVVDKNLARGCTVCVAFTFILGLLFIIPTIIQNISMYAWDLQVKQEHKILANYEKEERSIFIYRIVCYVGSFIVLCFSTLPTLIMVIARSIFLNSGMLHSVRLHYWGWCQFFVYIDMVTRSFLTGVVVIPLVIYFFLYCREVMWKGERRVKKAFSIIIKSVIPCAVICVLIYVPFTPFIFKKDVDETNSAVCHGGSLFKLYYFFEFYGLHVMPCLILGILIPFFLHQLEDSEYGILYEPGVYLVFGLPIVITQLVFEIFRSLGLKAILLSSSWYANFFIITLSFYHVSFSAVFLVFTIKNILGEIREERALKRRRPSIWKNNSENRDMMRRSIVRQYSLQKFEEEDSSAAPKPKNATAFLKEPKDISERKDSFEKEAFENYQVLLQASHHQTTPT